MPYEIDYDDDSAQPIREEPGCYECNDSRRARFLDPLFLVWRDLGQCPECDPTPERIAAEFAEYERRRLAGELDDPEPADPWEVF